MREFDTLLTFEEVAEILRIVEATPRGGQLTLQFGDASIMLKMTENTLTINSSEVVVPTSYTDNRVASPDVSDTQETPVSLEKEDHSSVEVRSQNLPARGHDGLVAISAPLTGIFYRSPSPSDSPFVEIDSAVEEGQQVGIIEVMKLMNRIVAPCSGVVREICAENQALAEYGTTLMWIDPGKAK
jgi:biotin carboxyl carrier protein